MPHSVGTLLHACATGRLAYEAGHADSDEGAAVTVVIASEGYPGSYETGRPILGVDEARMMEGVTVFHAGTTRDASGELVTAGGRVFAVTGQGSTLSAARERAYHGVSQIHFDGMRFRTDIAAHASLEAFA
jgi:phosphoribosylamine--glycine ligase